MNASKLKYWIILGPTMLFLIVFATLSILFSFITDRHNLQYNQKISTILKKKKDNVRPARSAATIPASFQAKTQKPCQ